MYNGVFLSKIYIYCLLAVHYFLKKVSSPLFDKVLNPSVNKVRSDDFIVNLERA